VSEATSPRMRQNRGHVFRIINTRFMSYAARCCTLRRRTHEREGGRADHDNLRQVNMSGGEAFLAHADAWSSSRVHVTGYVAVGVHE